MQEVRFITEWEEDFWNKKLIGWGEPPIDPALNPWNVNNEERKAGLRKLFTHLLEEKRREKLERIRKSAGEIPA